MQFSTAEVHEQAQALASSQPQHIMAWALETWGTELGLSFSGAEDVLLIDLARQTGLPFRVFSLDTGRLHPETLEYMERVRQHYGVDIEIRCPAAADVQSLVHRKGLFSFLQDGHHECCGVRKVAPLKQHLAGLQAWATGQRRDQSPTRAEVPVLQLDEAHGSAARPLFKVNPLANWTSEQVWRFIRGAGIPYNPLHERGFISIGCAPCTRAVLPGQHEREGRWWWEDAGQRECGLHAAEPASGG